MDILGSQWHLNVLYSFSIGRTEVDDVLVDPMDSLEHFLVGEVEEDFALGAHVHRDLEVVRVSELGETSITVEIRYATSILFIVITIPS